MASLKPLIMRANRLLGASLVEQNLVSIDNLDAANERLLELLSAEGTNNRVSLLSIMANEIGCLSEDAVLKRLVEDHSLGLVDVRNIELPDEIRLSLKTDECWATWSVPFDHVEDTRYMATAYYLSPAVRSYWEDKIAGRVIWFGTSLESIIDFLEVAETEKANASAAAAAGAN